MKTEKFDYGAFWLLVEPTQTIKYIGVFGFALVLIRYLYILLNLALWRERSVGPTSSSLKHIGAAQRKIVSLSTILLQTISKIAYDSERTAIVKLVANFALDLTSEATSARKFMVSWLAQRYLICGSDTNT